MYQERDEKSIFYPKRTKKVISIFCMIFLFLSSTAISNAEGTTFIHKSSGLKLQIVPNKEDASKTGLAICGYDKPAGSTGEVAISNIYQYVQDGENKWMDVVGIQAESFSEAELSSMEITSGVSNYTIGKNAFKNARIGLGKASDEDCFVISSDGKVVIGPYVFQGTQFGGNVRIAMTNGEVMYQSFMDCEIKGTLTIEGSINTIEEYAFSGINASKMAIPMNIVHIKDYAFANTRIIAMNLGAALETLGSNVFENCDRLEKIILAKTDSVKEAAPDALPNKEGLTIVVPEGLTDLSVYHLENHNKVVFQTAENLPANSPVLEYLKENDLMYKSGENGEVVRPNVTPSPSPTPRVTPSPTPTAAPSTTPRVTPSATPMVTPEKVPVSTSSPKPAATIKPAKRCHTIRNVKYRIHTKNSVTVTGVKNKKITKLRIPDTVTIDGRLYKVVKIEKKAFKKKKKLKTAIIGNYVKEIGNESFSQCKNLKKIQFGTGLKVLGKKVLYKDKKLKKIIFKGKKLRKIGKKTFFGVPHKVGIWAVKSKAKSYARLINRSKK